MTYNGEPRGINTCIHGDLGGRGCDITDHGERTLIRTVQEGRVHANLSATGRRPRRTFPGLRMRLFSEARNHEKKG